jgi:REP element-mobilizing transposase RayT
MLMPRRSRESSGTGIYHVMLRGINRQNIFYDVNDYGTFLESLRKLVHPTDEQHRPLPSHCIVYAYCLMPNHVHLLLQEKDEGLAFVMKSLGVAYAWHYNKKYQHLGPVFQDRYRSEPVNDNAYFFTLLRYIHQNPLKAGLVSDIRDYRYSSWNEYTGDVDPAFGVCNTDSVLSRMPLNELKEFVNDPLPDEVICLDNDNEQPRLRLSDDQVWEQIMKLTGTSDATGFQLLEREQQKIIIRKIRRLGASIRQLERLTGISRGVIQALA